LLELSEQFNWLQGEQKLFSLFEWIFGSDEKMDSQSPEVEISCHILKFAKFEDYIW